jgi:hypothetical protein
MNSEVFHVEKVTRKVSKIVHRKGEGIAWSTQSASVKVSFVSALQVHQRFRLRSPVY